VISLWKPAAIIGVLLAAYLWVSHIKSEAYAKGKADAETAAQKLLSETNEANAYRTGQLEKQIASYADKLAAKDDARHEQEATIKVQIEKELAKVPDCAIPQSIIDQRNAVRALP
jgi:uncharacterized protein YlxW (UPF0749 family)